MRNKILKEIERLKKTQAELQEKFIGAGYQLGILEHLLKEEEKPDGQTTDKKLPSK